MLKNIIKSWTRVVRGVLSKKRILYEQLKSDRLS